MLISRFPNSADYYVSLGRRLQLQGPTDQTPNVCRGSSSAKSDEVRNPFEFSKAREDVQRMLQFYVYSLCRQAIDLNGWSLLQELYRLFISQSSRSLNVWLNYTLPGLQPSSLLVHNSSKLAEIPTSIVAELNRCRLPRAQMIKFVSPNNFYLIIFNKFSCVGRNQSKFAASLTQRNKAAHGKRPHRV